MLSEVLKELRKSVEPLSSKDLAQRLSIERGALEGKLVKQGKLHKARQMTPKECQLEESEMEGCA